MKEGINVPVHEGDHHASPKSEVLMRQVKSVSKDKNTEGELEAQIRRKKLKDKKKKKADILEGVHHASQKSAVLIRQAKER